MKTKTAAALLYFLLAAFLLFSGCAKQRPREELIGSLMSPDEAHAMYIYRNGAEGGERSVTVTIEDVETLREKDIYYHSPETEPEEAVWIDNETVRINGIELNIYSGFYELQETAANE